MPHRNLPPQKERYPIVFLVFIFLVEIGASSDTSNAKPKTIGAKVLQENRTMEILLIRFNPSEINIERASCSQGINFQAECLNSI